MNCSCWIHAFFVQFKTTLINNFKLHNDQFDITGKFHFEIRTNFKSQKNCQSFLIIIIIIFQHGTSKEILLSPPELPKIWSLGFFLKVEGDYFVNCYFYAGLNSVSLLLVGEVVKVVVVGLLPWFLAFDLEPRRSTRSARVSSSPWLPKWIQCLRVSRVHNIGKKGQKLEPMPGLRAPHRPRLKIPLPSHRDFDITT